jgi:hypothetical protein
LYLTNAWLPFGFNLCGDQYMLNVHHGIMAQGLVASNKNGCFQIDFGTLVCRVFLGFPDFLGVLQDFPNYGAVIFV